MVDRRSGRLHRSPEAKKAHETLENRGRTGFKLSNRNQSTRYDSVESQSSENHYDKTGKQIVVSRRGSKPTVLNNDSTSETYNLQNRNRKHDNNALRVYVASEFSEGKKSERRLVMYKVSRVEKFVSLFICPNYKLEKNPKPFRIQRTSCRET